MRDSACRIDATDETVQQAADFRNVLDQQFGLPDQPLVGGNQYLSFDLRQRAAGGTQELYEFGTTAAGRTFCDAAGDGYGRAAQLLIQPRMLLAGQQSRCSVHFARQSNRFLPNEKVPVTGDRYMEIGRASCRERV